MFKPKYFLDKIVSRFTHFAPTSLSSITKRTYQICTITSVYCIIVSLYDCIIVSCMIVLLVRGVRGDCSGPVTGIVRGYPRRGRIGSAPPRVRVLGCRCSVVTIRGPGPSHWTRQFIQTSGHLKFLGVNSSVLQCLFAMIFIDWQF